MARWRKESLLRCALVLRNQIKIRLGSNAVDAHHGGSNLNTEIPEANISYQGRPPRDSAYSRVWSINVGKGAENGTDNSIRTTKYTLITFLPISIWEQFRRLGNVYFLCISIIMFIGNRFPTLFPSSMSYATIFIPLLILVSVSLYLEAVADLKKNASDKKSNSYPCVILRRVEDIDSDCERVSDILDGQDIDVNLATKLYPSPDRSKAESHIYTSIACVRVKREDIRAGDVVIVRNREMIPADLVLLGSSGENGGAYIETSQIDGETNLKLRKSPALPLGSFDVSTTRGLGFTKNYEHPKLENLLQAIERLTRMSLLGFPDGVSALHNPHNRTHEIFGEEMKNVSLRSSFIGSFRRAIPRKNLESTTMSQISEDTRFVATLTSELPNASVDTFSGKLTLPPRDKNSSGLDIPLDIENFLLRGAALRNTDWVIGLACFTGSDTKLVRNMIDTPSKLSRLDTLINQIVIYALIFMLACAIVLGILSTQSQNNDFEKLWYIGFNKEKTESWPYLQDFEAPAWNDTVLNPVQNMLTYITLLSNVVPLSLYLTVEITTKFMMFLISWDKNMYHRETNTPAAARSTIVSDLGLVEYIFSDKTGTLTQNVMKFKRCSVDGMMFGQSVSKSTPADITKKTEVTPLVEQEFYPLDKLPEGFCQKKANDSSGGVGSSQSNQSTSKTTSGSEPLTFNAEMFLRVMSICHTVVVEKEMNASDLTTTKKESPRSFWSDRKRKKKEARVQKNDNTPSISESMSNIASEEGDKDLSIPSQSMDTNDDATFSKNSQGAPLGYTYQAESPDEEALVSAASLLYDFQLKRRDINGLTISCKRPSLFSNKTITNGLKSGVMTTKKLASHSAQFHFEEQQALLGIDAQLQDVSFDALNEETWAILAINKFDSTRKRMSIVVRSPPELGSIPMLLCKGADSAILNPNVCGVIDFENTSSLILNLNNDDEDDGSDWEKSNLLGIQSHLGAFASEGLRTLVLGIRILSENECAEWLQKFEKASASLVDRDSAMTALAVEIEKNIHIVGCTAIEDKLQDGVPEAISNIGKSGIKLWVLTGDKRETAIEIGYSTKVLDPKMYLSDVSDGPTLKVRALIAMEFMRLVKMGKLSLYQNAALRSEEEYSVLKLIERFFRSFSRAYRRFYHRYLLTLCGTCNKVRSEKTCQRIFDEEAADVDPFFVRQRVRSRVERDIVEYLNSPEGIEEKRRSSFPERCGSIFTRAQSAINTSVMLKRKASNEDIGTSSENHTLDELPRNVIDEDTLSLQSVTTGETGMYTSLFDPKKLTLSERVFATDPDVRKGFLVKHLATEYYNKFISGTKTLLQTSTKHPLDGMDEDQHRALVIEGAALAHFLGDPVYEEILFSVASCCKSVIACRVSPKQKALLVKMVQNFAKPLPITLAIGDGANDVGMIQVAQIGVGISGLEGRQAVNASDFSIAQFRYLEELLLVHGRWNFIRLSKVVLLSFYKNALLASILIFFSKDTFYSGTLVINEWVGSTFNFISFAPVVLLGFFDRDLDREYIRKNPNLYASGPLNEALCARVTLRWLIIYLLQALILFKISHDIMGDVGAGVSSAFKGLMRHRDIPGDGEGGDQTTYGTTIFVSLVFLIIGKTLAESTTIIHGVWPAFTCRKNVGEGFWNRVAYTWHGNIFLGGGFTFGTIYIFQLLFKTSVFGDMLRDYTFGGTHTFSTRCVTWMVLILVIATAMVIDIVLKLFSNMFYPTQTQIHREIQWRDRL